MGGFISNLLFGDGKDKTDYKKAAYDKYYSDISNSTYDSMYGDMADYLDQNYAGGAAKYRADTLQGLQENAKNSLDSYKATKNDYFGNGLIGSFLNPIAQTASSVGDLTGLALSGGKANAWDKGGNELGVSRDAGSDLGALGETLLTLVPIGKSASLAKAGKAVNAGTATAKQAAKYAASQVPKTLGQKVASGALIGAGYGAAGGLRDMGFENFNAGQLGLSTAMGAGIGGGLAGAGGALSKYTSKKVPVVSSNSMPYQEALNNLKNNASGAMYSDVATTLPATRGLDISRITLDNLDNDTLKKLFRSSVKNAKSQVAGADTNAMTSTLTGNKNLLEEFLKNGAPTTTTYTTIKPKNASEAIKNLSSNFRKTKAGTKVSSLLKTKKGKIGAGVGGGLLLAKLMNGGGNNQNTGLSDEELMQLYNYYGGGY